MIAAAHPPSRRRLAAFGSPKIVQLPAHASHPRGMSDGKPMMLRPRRLWVPLLCLTLADATQNDASAASPKPIGEATRFIRAEPCGQTIRYKIGAIDKRFGIDEQRVMAAAAQAADLWNA